MFRLMIVAVLLMAGIPSSQAAQGSAVDIAGVVAELGVAGDAAMQHYRPDQGTDTADRFSDLYFDVFEASGLERAVNLRDPNRKAALEAQFAAVIGAAANGQPKARVAAAWQNLRSALEAVTRDFPAPDTPSEFWAVALQSFLILLREGFEAILVITALAAYLRKVGEDDKLRVIYQGVGWALAASAMTAYLFATVLNISGAGREALEGITLMIAAGMLFYVSYWLISKREAARWQSYVRGQIDRALSRGSLVALGMAAFLAVYREGAETVLFYQALLGQAAGQSAAVWSGFAGACAALGALYWTMRRAAFRLPLGPFFAVTAALLYYLAVSFAGSGVLELQNAGWVSITPAPMVPHWPWLGLFPSWEGVVVQGGLILLALVAGAGWWLRRPRSGEVAVG